MSKTIKIIISGNKKEIGKYIVLKIGLPLIIIIGMILISSEIKQEAQDINNWNKFHDLTNKKYLTEEIIDIYVIKMLIGIGLIIIYEGIIYKKLNIKEIIKIEEIQKGKRK